MLAFVFPGQGSQVVGPGKELADRYPAARRVFEEADEVLGFQLSRLCFEGPEEELALTANCQPAILANSVAALRALQEETDLAPDVVAGHSLGEFTALVCAGAMEFEDAVRIVRQRGELMQEAIPERGGAMAAIMGLSPREVEALCQEAAASGPVSPANLNGPAQTVIAGHADAVERAMHLASQRGARAQRLKVSAPFHCELMRPAAEGLRKALEQVRFKEPGIPVVANVTAGANRDAAKIRELLVDQVTRPVRWEECVRTIGALGVHEVIELGSRGTLANLIRRIDGDLAVQSVARPADIEALAPRARGETWSGVGFVADLKVYTRQWRQEVWFIRPGGVQVRGDRQRWILPDGLEWRFEDPAAHGF